MTLRWRLGLMAAFVSATGGLSAPSSNLAYERDLRWYAGFRLRGKPESALQQVEAVVRRLNVGANIPFVVFEKKPLREFYFFLAVDGAEWNQWPPTTEEISFLPALQSPQGPFSREAIKKMVGPDIDVRYYEGRIPSQVKRLLYQDPFDFSGLSDVDEGEATDIVLKSQALDRLLLWISATGDGSWGLFMSACQRLGLDPESREARRIIRRLRLLGHVEGSGDGEHWFVTLPTLVRCGFPADSETYFLAGARDPRLLAALQRCCAPNISSEADGLGPARIAVDGVSLDRLREVLTAEYQGFPVQMVMDGATELAEFLPDLTGWRESLQQVHGVIPELYELRRWTASGLVSADTATMPSGFYELRPLGAIEDSPGIRHQLFFDAASNRWFRGDWYGLRFLGLHSLGHRCSIRYEHETGQLFIPYTCRWPELFERTLVLSTGRLPRNISGGLLYDAIAPEVLATVTSKLGITVED